MFTNEDFADYVVCVSKLYTEGKIHVTKAELIEIINHYYPIYCYARHLYPMPLVPIRSIEKMTYWEKE